MPITSWADVLPYLLTAVLGGGVLKWADAWLNRTKARNENAKHLRDETRADIINLKEELRYYKEEIRKMELLADQYKLDAWEARLKYGEFQMQVSQILIDNGIKPRDVLRKE